MTSRRKILLVDNEQAITANLVSFLERAGFAVTVAANGEEILRQAGGFGGVALCAAGGWHARPGG